MLESNKKIPRGGLTSGEGKPTEGPSEKGVTSEKRLRVGHSGKWRRKEERLRWLAPSLPGKKILRKI